MSNGNAGKRTFRKCFWNHKTKGVVIWTAIEAFHNVHNEPVLAVNHRCGISGNQRFYNVRARKHLLTANLSLHVVSMLTTWKLRLAVQ